MMKNMLERIDYSIPGNKGKMNCLFWELLENVKENDEELYNKVKMDIYVMVNGEKLTQECAEKWVKNMQPIGQHWTIDETTSAMQSLGYNLDRVDFYAIANMIYNDQYDLVKEDETLALKMAYNWLNDVDATKNKTFIYWQYVPEKDY